MFLQGRCYYKVQTSLASQTQPRLRVGRVGLVRLPLDKILFTDFTTSHESPHIYIINTYVHMYIHTYIHCKNKIVKISNLLVSTVARNNLNCNLIGRVGFYGYTLIFLCCLIVEYLF